MGSETKELAKISYVTDTDVSYYEIGEVEGNFKESELKDYIKIFGHEKLCSQLAFMQFQIWKTLREINREKSDDESLKSCVKN